MNQPVAIVTGGNAGIGRAIVEACRRDGYICYSFDRVPPEEGGAEALTVDVSSEAGVTTGVAEVLDRHGRVDALFNNAGMLGRPAAFHDLTLDDWNQVLAVNLAGIFLMSRAVIPAMLDAGHGAIVNTSSIAGLIAGGGSTAYSASKAGVIGLTRAMAYEYGPSGIRVNAIAPGATRTGLADHVRVDGRHPNPLQQHRIETTPLRRISDPTEIAEVAVFMASDRASFVTGALWTVDGGWTAS